MPVRNIRKIGKRDMVRNSGTPKIEVNPETFAVTVDGKHATVAPLKTVSLNQKYFCRWSVPWSLSKLFWAISATPNGRSGCLPLT